MKTDRKRPLLKKCELNFAPLRTIFCSRADAQISLFKRGDFSVFLSFVLFPFFFSFCFLSFFRLFVLKLSLFSFVGWLVLQEVSIFSRTVFYPGKTLNIASNKILKHKYLIVLSQVAFLIFLPIYYLQLIVHGVIYVTLSYDLFR